MITSCSFFNNSINFEYELPYNHLRLRIENLSSISSHFQKMLIFIDHHDKKIQIRNNNKFLADQLTLCTNSDFEEESIFMQAIPNDHKTTLARAIKIVNDHCISHCSTEDNVFYFSFLLPLKTKNNGLQMCLFNAIPYLHTDLSAQKKPWITLYQCDPIDSDRAGNITLHIPKKPTKTYYLFKPDSISEFTTLTETEIQIFALACQGFSELETASILNLSVGTLKHIKSAIMLSINAQSTAQTVAILNNQGLL